MTAEDLRSAAGDREAVAELLAWIGGSRRRFDRVAEWFHDPDPRVARRAGRAMLECVTTHPAWLAGHVSGMLARWRGCPAVARLTFRMWMVGEIPPDCTGGVLHAALAALSDRHPVAVRANALSVLARTGGSHPEWMDEVRAVVDAAWQDAPPGFRARVRREFGRAPRR